jgi:hypothetical protein
MKKIIFFNTGTCIYIKTLKHIHFTYKLHFPNRKYKQHSKMTESRSKYVWLIIRIIYSKDKLLGKKLQCFLSDK